MFPKIKNGFGMTKSSVLLATFLLILLAIIFSYSATAAVSSDPLDTMVDQLRNQLSDVMNTPVDFCDGAVVHAHYMAMASAQNNLMQEELKKPHPPIQQMIQHGIENAVQANKANGGDLVEDLPYVSEYEKAERRRDIKAQNELFAEMSPLPRRSQRGGTITILWRLNY